MNDMEIGKLLARMDNLEKTTDSRHQENKLELASMQLKLDILVRKFSEARGGWFVLTVLGSVAIGLALLISKVAGLKFGG